MDGKIYCITNLVTGKRYVGKTSVTIAQRFSAHCRSHHNTPLTMAIAKYGAALFTVQQIDSADSRAKLDRLETMWIDAMNTRVPNGYNLRSGGDGGTHAPETRAKLLALTKDATYKAKQKAGLRRYWDIPQNRQWAVDTLVEIRRRNYAAGKRHKSHQETFDRNVTPEWREKRGELQRTIWRRPEYREKMQRYLSDPAWREKRRLAVIEGLRRRKAARKEGSQ